MTDGDKKDNNPLGIMILVIILILLVCGGYFVCNNFVGSGNVGNVASGVNEFGKVSASNILGGGFNY